MKEEVNWIAYYINPIDFGWENLKPVHETVGVLAQEESYNNDINSKAIKSFIRNWKLAKEKAKNSGWEGDFREPPKVFWLPSETEFVYGFVFKQENNGDTIVVSPYQLPWLEKIATCVTK